jgi:hypothetical protein
LEHCRCGLARTCDLFHDTEAINDNLMISLSSCYPNHKLDVVESLDLLGISSNIAITINRSSAADLGRLAELVSAICNQMLPTRKKWSRKLLKLVDLVGIEPTTSSMPWKRAPSCATGPLEEGIPPLRDSTILAQRKHDSQTESVVGCQ